MARKKSTSEIIVPTAIEQAAAETQPRQAVARADAARLQAEQIRAAELRSACARFGYAIDGDITAEAVEADIALNLRLHNEHQRAADESLFRVGIGLLVLRDGCERGQWQQAADLQTGALGDVEICVTGEDSAVTVYEMKMKRVTPDDIDAAALKIARAPQRIHNYLFITTDAIIPAVAEYAATFYEKLDGTEIAILDCTGFLRHFLHLFHRLRAEYLNAYQELVLAEPDSAVSQSLKEAFLALRQAAESGE